MVYYPQELGRNKNEILTMRKAIRVSDRNKVALTTNRPNNELIGDKVIVPPATDIKAAEYKKGKYENYDWWFCYKNLEK